MIAANVVFAAAFRPVACRPATGVTSAVVGDDLRGRGQPGPDELPAAVVCQSDVDQHQGVARLDDRQGQDTAVDRDHHLRWTGIHGRARLPSGTPTAGTWASTCSACQRRDAPARRSCCFRQPYAVTPRGLYTDSTVATSSRSS